MTLPALEEISGPVSRSVRQRQEAFCALLAAGVEKRQAMARLRISKATFYRWRNDGKFRVMYRRAVGKEAVRLLASEHAVDAMRFFLKTLADDEEGWRRRASAADRVLNISEANPLAETKIARTIVEGDLNVQQIQAQISNMTTDELISQISGMLRAIGQPGLADPPTYARSVAWGADPQEGRKADRVLPAQPEAERGTPEPS